MFRLLIFTILTTDVLCDCDNTKPVGPFELFTDYPEVHASARVSRNVQVVTLKQEPTVIIGYRQAWKSYCYNGGSLDSNTGCFDEIIDLPPGPEELKTWLEIGACKTGPTYINQWGSDSDKCLQDLDAIKTQKTYKKKEMKKYSSNNHFAHHTCNLDWRCGFHQEKVNYLLKETTIKILDETGQFQNQENVETYHMNKEFGYLYQTDGNRNKVDGKMSCFNKGEHAIEGEIGSAGMHCWEKTSGTYWNVLGKFANHTDCQGQVCVVYKGKKAPLREETLSRAGEATKEETDTKALGQTLLLDEEHTWKIHPLASSEEVKSNFHLLWEDIAFDIEGVKYDLSQLYNHQVKLIKVVLGIVNSLGKIDDRLIGNIMNRAMSTQFVTDNKFVAYACSHEQHCETESDEFRERYCDAETKAQKIKLFEKWNFWAPILAQLDYKENLGHLPGWSFVKRSREALRTAMEVTKNSGLTSGLGDVLQMGPGQLLNSLNGLTGFSVTGGVILIIIVVVLCCFCVRG